MQEEVAEAPSKGRYRVESVWTEMLGRRFTPVSSAFLTNMHRIAPEGDKPLSSTEAMVIIQLISFKWDNRPPRPALRTIANRLSLSVRAVREAVRRLEDRGLLRREINPEGGASQYYFEGLFRRLEELMASDAAAADAADGDATEAA